MSRFFNSNTLSFAAGVLVGSASSYFYCRYSRKSSCAKNACDKSSDSEEEEKSTIIKEIGKIIRV